MIWVESKHKNIKTIFNLPFIGQFILIFFVIIPPYAISEMFNSFYKFELGSFGNPLASLLFIWCHFLWKKDIQILFLFIPVWILLLLRFLLECFNFLINFL